mgnify:CR=1 FL=1
MPDAREARKTDAVGLSAKHRKDTMTPQEIAETAKRAILAEAEGINVFIAHGRPYQWAEFGEVTPEQGEDRKAYLKDRKDLLEAAGVLLIEQGVIKEDNRTKRGIGTLRGYGFYRVSRGWYNRSTRQ